MGSQKISDWIDVLGEVYRDYQIENPSNNGLRDWVDSKTTEVFGNVATIRGVKDGTTINSNTGRKTNLSGKGDVDDLIYDWLSNKDDRKIKKHLQDNKHKIDDSKAEKDIINIENFFNNHKL